MNILQVCVSDYFSSLTEIHNVLVSCFSSSRTTVLREEYVSLSDDPNDVLCIGPTAFCCAFSFAAVFCFISHFFEMCANMLEFNQNHCLLLSPTLPCLPRFPETVGCGVLRPAYGYTTASNWLRIHVSSNSH